MLLINFLGLITKLTSVSSDCDIGSSGVKNFDCNKVGISAFSRFLQQAPFTPAAWVHISLVVPLTNCQ